MLFPEDAGAYGNGVRDDTAAIQSAIDAAAAYNGVATIRLTTGKTYRCASTLSLDGASGVTFAGGGTLLTEGSQGITCIQSDGAYAEQLIDEADEGDTLVTTTSTPSGLTAGDYVLIYTGQTTTNGNGAVGTADAEINRVASVVGNTVNLQWALTKNYRQEAYENPGEGIGTGRTVIGGSGNDAPLALRKIDPATDITFDEITIDHNGSSAWLAGHQIVNLTLNDLTVNSVGNFISISGWTGSMTDCTVHVQTKHAYWFAVAYGARDVTCSGCTFTADTFGYCHIHEGASDITVSNTTMTNAAATASDGTQPFVIGMRSRGYNITLDTVTVTNAPTDNGACLRVDANVSGSATGCTFDISGGGFQQVANLSADFTVS